MASIKLNFTRTEISLTTAEYLIENANSPEISHYCLFLKGAPELTINVSQNQTQLCAW